jgi:hypothetical protein
VDEFSNGHEIFNTQRIQNGSYWLGAALGAMVMLLIVLIVERNTEAPMPSATTMPRDVVEAYRMGLKDALRTNPPSLELEQTCVNMWANKQPVR